MLNLMQGSPVTEKTVRKILTRNHLVSTPETLEQCNKLINLLNSAKVMSSSNSLFLNETFCGHKRTYSEM